jgi:hypothetical protein
MIVVIEGEKEKLATLKVKIDPVVLELFGANTKSKLMSDRIRWESKSYKIELNLMKSSVVYKIPLQFTIEGKLKGKTDWSIAACMEDDEYIEQRLLALLEIHSDVTAQVQSLITSDTSWNRTPSGGVYSDIKGTRVGILPFIKLGSSLDSFNWRMFADGYEKPMLADSLSQAINKIPELLASPKRLTEAFSLRNFIGLGDKKKKKSQQWYEKLAEHIKPAGWVLQKGEKFQASFTYSNEEEHRFKVAAGQKLIVNVAIVEKKRTYSARTFTGSAGPHYVYGRGSVRGDACIIQSDSDLDYNSVKQFIIENASGREFNKFRYWCDDIRRDLVTSIGALREFRAYMKVSTKKVTFEIMSKDNINAAVKNISASEPSKTISDKLIESVKSERSKKRTDDDTLEESWLYNEPEKKELSAEDARKKFAEYDEDFKQLANRYGFTIKSRFSGYEKVSKPNMVGRAFQYQDERETESWGIWDLELESGGNFHVINVEISDYNIMWEYQVLDHTRFLLARSNNFSARDYRGQKDPYETIEDVGERFGKKQSSVSESVLRDVLDEGLLRRDDAIDSLNEWTEETGFKVMWVQEAINWSSATACVASQEHKKEIVMIWSEPYEGTRLFFLPQIMGPKPVAGWKWYGEGKSGVGFPTEQDFAAYGAELFTYLKGDKDITAPSNLDQMFGIKR